MTGYKIPQGTPNDARLAVVAARAGLSRAETLALWIALHDHASRQTPRGSLDGLDGEEIAVTLGIGIDRVQQAIEALRDKGLIACNAIAGWDDTQTRRTSTARVRAFRARRKNIAASPATTPAPRRAPAAPPRDNPDDDTAVAARRARLMQEKTGAQRRHPPLHEGK